MKTIWKFPLVHTHIQNIKMPGGANILSAHDQDGAICLWAEVEDSLPCEECRTICIVGTGTQFPNGNVEFIGTVIQPPFVWHIYEKTS